LIRKKNEIFLFKIKKLFLDFRRVRGYHKKIKIVIIKVIIKVNIVEDEEATMIRFLVVDL